MIVTAKIKLADARAELGLSQATLATSAGLSKQVIVNGEKGISIQRLSAHAILKALNVVRQDNGMTPLSITDIDWKIQGDVD